MSIEEFRTSPVQLASNLTSLPPVCALFDSVKITTFRGNFRRLIGVTPNSLITIDPSSCGITNTWEFGSTLVDVVPVDDPKHPNCVNITWKEGKKDKGRRFSCDQRLHLLSE